MGQFKFLTPKKSWRTLAYQNLAEIDSIYLKFWKITKNKLLILNILNFKFDF